VDPNQLDLERLDERVIHDDLGLMLGEHGVGGDGAFGPLGERHADPPRDAGEVARGDGRLEALDVGAGRRRPKPKARGKGDRDEGTRCIALVPGIRYRDGLD
jgi:hypothetical protein